MYNVMDGFDWDWANIEKNKIKHGVEPNECEEIFFERPLVTLKDIKHSQTERRYKALGITKKGRKLHVTFVIRKNKIRVISTRDQSRKERKLYEKSYQNK